MSLSITTIKMPFLSSLLISLRYKSVKGVSCTRTDISVGGGYLADMSVKVSVEVRWFSVVGFLVMGCFWGRFWPYFTAGLVGLVSLRGTFRVSKSAYSLFSLASTFNLSSLIL